MAGYRKEKCAIIRENQVKDDRIMAQFILMFGLNKNKEAAVRTVSTAIGATVVAVPRKDYSQKLGTLAKVQGFSRDKTVYSGPDFPAEMLIFSGKGATQQESEALVEKMKFNVLTSDSEEVAEFLAEYKKQGVPAIGLKAIVTPNNVFWTPETLLKELLKEHMSMTNSGLS